MTKRFGQHRCIWGRRLAGAISMVAGACFGAGASHGMSSTWDQTEMSEVRLISAVQAVGQADSVRVGLQFRLAEGWKIYWRTPGDAGLPPRPQFDDSENFAAADISWPAPQRFTELGDLETAGYTDQVVLPIDVRLDQVGQPLALRAVVDYQACEKICVPLTANVALDLPAGPATPSDFAQLIDKYAARVPAAPGEAGMEIVRAALDDPTAPRILEVVASSVIPFEDPALFVEGPGGVRFGSGDRRLEDGGRRAVLTAHVQGAKGGELSDHAVMVTLVDGRRGASFTLASVPDRTAPMKPPADDAAETPPAGHAASFLAMIGAALLGGLILNLMPCVLPVLSVKLFGVIKHAGAARRTITLSFLASAAGIVVSFLLLAAAAIGLKYAGAAIGWGAQFQQPVFLAFMIVVIMLFAYNLFGLFDIAMPQWVGAAAVRVDAADRGAEPALGASFLTGALATLLATPCSAPFLGTAVGFALSRGWVEILAIFLALGIGMAAPYLIIAAAPGLAARLPRPGRWMIWLRWALALTLVATAVWLLSVLAIQSGLAAAALIAVLMAVVGLALAARWTPVASLQRVAVPAVAACAALALAAPTFLGTTTVALPVSGAATDESAIAWTAFEREAIPELVAAEKIVFVDVTADWCITCKVNKQFVLESEEVRGLFASTDIVAMKADWTLPDPAIAAFLASFGRYGIPFNVVYGPGAPDGIVLSELLSKTDVRAALDDASGRVHAAAD